MHHKTDFPDIDLPRREECEEECIQDFIYLLHKGMVSKHQYPEAITDMCDLGLL